MPSTDTFELVTGRMNKANTADAVAAVSSRVEELKALNSDQLDDRSTVRDILDGGTAGLKAIIGRDFRSTDPRVPAANLMLSALTRLAQKTGRLPDVNVDPPANDTESAHKAAERRARIVAGFDRAAKLLLQAPQMARWTPGYGFTPYVVELGRTMGGDLYPRATIRDSYNAFPAQWGIDQQPPDIAFEHLMAPAKLIERFPGHAEAIRDLAKGSVPAFGGGVSTSSYRAVGWGTQSGGGVKVYEYHNLDGIWWVLPSKRIMLSFTPNALSRPAFHVVKRFSFNKLIGQYDHVIGLMAAMARLNVLSIIAAEDAVFAETNIEGEMAKGTYQRGRNAFNYLRPGTSVQRMSSNVAFEVFQQIDRLERQLRVTAGYAVTDDAQSPSSWATGRGLAELTSAVDLEIQEYFTVYRDGFESLDSLRLELAEKVDGANPKTVSGVLRGAPFTERYTPRTAIRGNWTTRRAYGAMAGFDDHQQIVAGLQLKGAKVIARQTMQENLSGLEDLVRENDRIRAEQAEDALFQFMMHAAEPGAQIDPRVPMTLIEMLPESDMKTRFQHFWTPEEPEITPEEAAMMGMGGGEDQLELPGQMPDVNTVLSILDSQGGVRGGAQTLSRF